MNHTNSSLSTEQFDDLSGESGLLHLTRLLPFCQIFAAVDDPIGLLLVNGISTQFPNAFQSMMEEVKSLFEEYLDFSHNELIGMPPRSRITHYNNWLTNLFGAASSLASLMASEECADLFSRKRLESKDIIAGLTSCYESDLPLLAEKLSESVQAKDEIAHLRQSVAHIRLQLLITLGEFVRAIMKFECTLERRGEVLLEFVSLLVTLSNSELAEQGTFIADLWTIIDFKSVIIPFLKEAHIGEERIYFLENIMMAVPQRGANASSHARANSQSVHQLRTTRAKPDDSMIKSIKELFPSFGDGFIELLLIKNDCNVERAINQMLEGEPLLISTERPPESLQRSDREFARLLSMVSGIHPSNEIADAGSRVWFGKKSQDEGYDPRVARHDPNLAELTKRLNEMHATEQSVFIDEIENPTYTIDEYDDEYDDEFDDVAVMKAPSEPETVDDILAYNRRIRAKEEEEAYWKSMRNPNHVEAQEASSGEEAFESEISVQQSTSTETSNTTNPSPNTTVAHPVKSKRARARDTANKSKAANHHRKDRALKKRGF